jgi:hypothetical protein
VSNLQGGARRRRVILLRHKLLRDLIAIRCGNSAQLRLSSIEVEPDQALWESAAAVTSLDDEILTLGQLYCGRADCETTFDDLKIHWGWGGFTTHDLIRCWLVAGPAALIYNWWSLAVRLADRECHREAITSRPLLLTAVGPPDPAFRVGEPDHQEHPRHAAQGTDDLCSKCRLPDASAAANKTRSCINERR